MAPRGWKLESSLGWLVCLLGFCTILVTAYLAVRVYSPVWFADDWQVPMDYLGLGGHYPLARLWAQHNEHRVPLVKIAMLLDLFWLHGNHAVLILLNFCFQVAEWAAVSYFAARLFEWSRAELATAAGVGAFLVVNPNQLQNLEWAFSSFFSTFTFAIVAVGSLCLYRRSEKRNWLVLAGVSALLAEISLASGVLTLLVLPVTALLLGMSYRKVGALAGVAIAGLGIYLVGYSSPGNATPPVEALGHLDQVTGFLLAYFGESWQYVLPGVGTTMAACALFAVVTLTLYKLVWRGDTPPGDAFLLSIALLCMATGFVTALGRQGNGVEQAREGRYQTPAMLFWCAVALLVWSGLRLLGKRRSVAAVAFQVIICALCFGEAAHLRPLYQQHRSAGYIRDTAGAALESGVDALDRIRMIYPAPTAVPPTYAFLSSQGWMRPPLGMQPWMGQRFSAVFHKAAAGACLGATGTITALGMKNGRKELFAEGWAFSNSQPLSRLVATTEDGVIEGLGVMGAERTDVVSAVPQVTELESGWNLYALVPIEARQLAIYGLIGDTGTACELPYPQPVPARIP